MPALVSLGIVMLACGATPQAHEPLYFAIELKQDGRTIGHPKLLGELGTTLRVERRQPGAADPDYRLVLTPSEESGRYRIALDISAPGSHAHSELDLAHGEEQRITLGTRRELEVSLLVLRVHSREFDALMALSEKPLTI